MYEKTLDFYGDSTLSDQKIGPCIKCCLRQVAVVVVQKTSTSIILFIASRRIMTWVTEVRVDCHCRELDGTSYAEEVLVTKSELEEKKQRMSELETQVSPLICDTSTFHSL